MKQKALLIILILTGLFSCNTNKQKKEQTEKQTVEQIEKQTVEQIEKQIEKQPQNIKLERIRTIIKKSEFIELPLTFNADIDTSLKSSYFVDFESLDSLIFDRDIFTIIGFLPDTTEYFAFLFNSIGDMLYPTIMTLDKNGDKIDRQTISAAGCTGLSALDLISCYDSVWLYQDLKFKSISKMIATIDVGDSISEIINICNTRILDGYIENNGSIKIRNSSMIDCNEKFEE